MIFVQRGFLLIVTYVLLVHFTLEICSRRAANGAANAEAKSIANARTKESWSIFKGRVGRRMDFLDLSRFKQ